MSKVLLHLGCGDRTKEQTTHGFKNGDWVEIRFDGEASANPDIEGDSRTLDGVQDESVDAVFCSHHLQHHYANDIPLVLESVKRVLKPDGFVILVGVDLQAVARLVAEDKLTEAAYTTETGIITPLDLLYGHRGMMAKGDFTQVHRSGLTMNVLMATLKEVSFGSVVGYQRPETFEYWVVASKNEMPEANLKQLAIEHQSVSVKL